MVEYTYPWLLPKCFTCYKWGHLQDVCLAKEVQKEQSILQSAAVVMEAEEKTESPSISDPLIEKVPDQSAPVLQIQQLTLSRKKIQMMKIVAVW